MRCLVTVLLFSCSLLVFFVMYELHMNVSGCVGRQPASGGAPRPLNNSPLDKYWMLLFEAHINQYFEVACLSFHGQGGKRTSLGACRCLVLTCS